MSLISKGLLNIRINGKQQQQMVIQLRQGGERVHYTVIKYVLFSRFNSGKKT